MLTINHQNEKNLLECFFEGRLDTVASEELNPILHHELTNLQNSNPDFDQSKIMFDLKEVDYIASSFIRICMKTAKQVPQGNFSIVNCNPFVKKTFKIAGLDETLNIH